MAASLVVVAVLLFQKIAQPMLMMKDKQVAYLALEAKPKLVAAHVKLEHPLRGTSRSQRVRRKHAKGIAGSLMN